MVPDRCLYVPVLKAKDGELKALRELADTCKSRLTPVMEIPKPPRDWTSAKPKPLGEHLAQFGPKLARSWGAEQLLFVDAPFLPAGAKLDGRSPAKALFERLRDEGVVFAPVTGVRRERTYQSAVAAAVAKDRRGVLVRIEQGDLADLLKLAQRLSALLTRLNVKAKDVWLMLDLKEVDGGIETRAPGVRAILAGLPTPKAWRELILGGVPASG